MKQNTVECSQLNLSEVRCINTYQLDKLDNVLKVEQYCSVTIL